MGNKIIWAFALVIAVVAAVSGTAVAIANPIPTSIVYFATEDFSLSPSQKDALDALLPQLETATKVTVDGYVQRSLPENKNKGPANLSFKRADAVTKYLQNLVKQRSKNKQTIEWVENGKGQPITGYWSPDARRAEVFIASGAPAPVVEPTETASPTVEPTVTPTVTPTASPTDTPTPTLSPTASPTETVVPTPTPTETKKNGK